MKSVIVFAALLLWAGTAAAGVVVQAVHDGNGVVAITYDCNGSGQLIRGFALNISVDGGAKITGASDFYAKYNIYPGSIQIVGSDVNDYGSPVCDAAVYPDTGTLGGLGTDGITIEMAAVYDKDAEGQAPAANGVLCRITVDKSCNVTITPNTARRGIVMEDATVAVDAALKGCVVNFYPEWDCPSQANGDADCSGTVAEQDLNIVKLSWMKSSATDGYDPAADFNHDGKVNLADLAVIRRNYMQSFP